MVAYTVVKRALHTQNRNAMASISQLQPFCVWSMFVFALGTLEKTWMYSM